MVSRRPKTKTRWAIRPATVDTELDRGAAGGMIPALTRPTKAMARPMPTEIVVLSWRGRPGRRPHEAGEHQDGDEEAFPEDQAHGFR